MRSCDLFAVDRRGAGDGDDASLNHQMASVSSSLHVVDDDDHEPRDHTSNAPDNSQSIIKSINHKSLCSIATSRLELLHNAV